MHFLTSLGMILALTGIILICLLKKTRLIADQILIAILMSFMTKYLLDDLYLRTGNVLFSSIAVLFGISTITSCGLYIKYIAGSDLKFDRADLIQYSPFLIFLLIISVYFLGYSQNNFYLKNFHIILIVVSLLIIAYNFFFCISMLQRQKQLIMEFYAAEPGNITINWIKMILGLQILELILKIIFTYKTFGSLRNINVVIVTNEYCYILETFLLVVFGIWQEHIVVLPGELQEVGPVELDRETMSRYQRKLENFMLEHQPFLDPDLTIEKLSEQTKIKKLVLSQILNKGFQKNFFNYIKEYRIRYVEQLLVKEADKTTIMAIAYKSGFNSKTGFNRAFKELTGKTPTEYIEKAG